MNGKKRILIGIAVIGTLILFISSAHAAWWDSSWENKREVKIDNTGGSTLTYYQVNVNLTDSPINTTSLRVVNETVNATVSHWCENETGGNCYDLWFNATSVPASSWLNGTYYIYYSNSAASSNSSGINTFDHFDGFESGTKKLQYNSTSGDVNATQGVTTDGSYFYVSDNDYLAKHHYSNWTHVQSRDVSNDGPAEKTQINHLFYIGGKIYAGSCNYGSDPAKAWVLIYHASNLSFIEYHYLGTGLGDGEGCTFYDNHWWCVGGGQAKIQKYNSTWSLIGTYDIDFSTTGDARYCPGCQGIIWIDNCIYVTKHKWCGFSKYGIFEWNGSGFTLISKEDPPTASCQQGLSLDPNDKYVWWAERVAAGNNPVVKSDIFGAIGSEWASNAGTFTHSNSKPLTGIYSGFWAGTLGNDLYEGIFYDFGAKTSDFVLEFSIYKVTDGFQYVRFGTSETYPKTEWKPDELYSRITTLRHPNTGNILIDPFGEGWCDYTLIEHPSSNTFDLRITGTYDYSADSLAYDAAATPRYMSAVDVSSGTNKIDIYIDNVRIRKYTATEPTFILGTEEAESNTYTCSGYVKNATGIPISTVYITNNRTADSDYTNASGYYILIDLENATYNVTASKSGYNTNHSVSTISGLNLTNQNITLSYEDVYIPPTPTNLQNETGDTWINWTWEEGSGNETDSFNVSITGNSWLNSSSNMFYNKTVTCIGESFTISVYAFNETGSGSISVSNVTDTQNVTSLSWANASYNYRAIACVENISTGNYQINFSLHTGTGTNNATSIFMNNHNATSDYSDIVVYNQSGTALGYWIEDNTLDPTTLWINATENGSVQFYYGCSGATSSANGVNTFDVFDLSNISALWHFDETSWDGTTGEVKDETKAHNGTRVANADTTTDAKFKRAGAFDGSGDYVDVITELVPDGHTGGWTGCVWLKSPEGSVRRQVYETTPSYAMSLGFQTDDSLNAYALLTDASSVACGEGNYDDSAWHFVCARFNGTDNKIMLYVDGSIKCASSPGAVNSLESTTGFYIGTYRDANDRWFNGVIDELVIFNTSIDNETLSKMHENYLDKNGEYFNVRKYVSSDPTITFGSEEQQEGAGTIPTVSNITNGSVSATSQWVDWDVNQTAHNRVMYSNESDFTPVYYSDWENSTNAPNITLTALTSNTKYYYQAWSYNTSNTSLTDNSSTFDFTTAQEGTGDFTPPNPTNIENINGNFWVNHTWDAGTGNVTDSYNVSINSTWHNTTATLYYNNTGLTAHCWSNATVWAFNSSGNGSLSAGSDSENVQIPNNPITVTVTQSHTKLETKKVFISDTSSSDADTDTPTYSCNRTDLFSDFSTATGHGNWTPGTTDSGMYYVNIGVSDGWGSTDNKTLTITINDATPGGPIGSGTTTGNFWVNCTWGGGANTDTFNVSVNMSWNNVSLNEYHNNTNLSAHGWSNVTVWAFNATSSELSASNYSLDTQIPNNAPILTGLPDNTTDENTNQTDIFDLDDYFTDADSDTPTFLVESNNQSSNVSVSINASNNVSYTLMSGWSGNAEVVVNATDGWGGENNDIFVITVIAAPAEGTQPSVSGVTNGTVSGYSQWINWTVNQTAHNQVKYSNESDLTPTYWSSWKNTTATPNISLTGLTPETQYWYQAWSYNTTNTSLTDNSSTMSFNTSNETDNPVISNMSVAPTLVYEGNSVVITCTVTCQNASIINATVRVKNPSDVISNYAMSNISGTNNWTFTYSYTGKIGTYYILNFIAFNTLNQSTNQTSTLTFRSRVRGGGGGGGGYIPEPTPTYTPTPTPTLKDNETETTPPPTDPIENIIAKIVSQDTKKAMWILLIPICIIVGGIIVLRYFKL